jgi:Carboxypeptidase regulatory-like domain
VIARVAVMSLFHLSLLVFLVRASSSSHYSTRTVQGVVADQHDNRLDHAVVQLDVPATLAIRSCITQSDGAFHFTGLRRDIDYDLRADFDGVRSKTERISKFDSREKVDVWLRIRLGR